MVSDRITVVFAVLLLAISIESASARSRFQSTVSLPVKRAKEMIFGLNDVGPQDGRKRIVERRIMLPGLNYTMDGDSTFDYIGHHSGYYNVKHSNAAR